MVALYGCSDKETFDLQGHRGARGMMPENTIPGFIYAIEQGVTTLELDLAVTRDQRLVVSHEPYMSSLICLDSLGREYADSLEHQYNIFRMTYEEVRQFDCGLKAHPHFPEQKKMPVAKPLLADVVDTVSAYLQARQMDPTSFNLEIKSHLDGDDVFHPSPAVFSKLVYQFVQEHLDWERVTIQSFDVRVLQYFHQQYPHVQLAFLVENDLSPEENLEKLGFTPHTYSPYYPLLSQQSLRFLQQQGMKVIPWTVNEVEEMGKLRSWGVDGLITDYPNKYNELAHE